MKEKYHIYNYLKNHEGALIALASGLAGFIIMVLNFVLHTADKFYLSTWNCNLIPIENSPSRFYSLCIWFVFFIANMFLGKILAKTSLDSQNEVIRLNLYLRNLKKNKKEVKEWEALLKKEKELVNEEKEKNKLQELSNKIDSLKLDIRLLKKDVTKEKIKVHLKSILKVLIISVAYSIPISLIKYLQTFELIRSLKSTFITIIGVLIVLIPLSIVAVNVISSKTSTESEDLQTHPNDFLSDSMIVRNCKKAVLNFLFIVIAIYLTCWGKNLPNNEFDIFSIGNQEYASIYESEHYLIGKKITYGNSKITFYLNNQIIVEKKNLSIVRKKFETVEKSEEFPLSPPNIDQNTTNP